MAIAIDFEKLRDWINGDQDYLVGVALYVTYGNIKQLKTIFKSNPLPTELIRRKLLSEIKRIYLSGSKSAQGVHYIAQDAKKVAPSENKLTPDATDPAYLEEKERVMLLFKEQSALHSQLDSTEDEQLRKEICLKILALDKQVSAGWDALDYYKSHGEFQVATAKKELTVIEKVKRRNTLRSYISREKNPDKLAAYKLELATIEEALTE